MSNKMNILVGVLILLGVLASMTLFKVDKRDFAIIFQLGEIKEVISEPGLKVKLPLIQNVRYFDKRILTIDSTEPERFITAEKQNVLVDHFVKWRIIDPRLYYSRRYALVLDKLEELVFWNLIFFPYRGRCIQNPAFDPITDSVAVNP